MTNSEPSERSSTTSTVGLITQDTAKEPEYVSNKGTPWSIRTKPNGLFYVTMDGGGIKPSLTDELFTRKKLAEAALERYIKSTDRTGYAVYPSKTKAKQIAQSNTK